MAVLGFEVIAIGLISLLLYWMYKGWRSSERLPPMPKGHFIFGNAKQLDPQRPHNQLAAWKQELGDVFMINMMGTKIVVVNGAEPIREVLITKSNDFTGRPFSVRLHGIFDFQDTISFTDDTDHWKDLKKAVINGLKMYGDNLLHLEEVALESLQKTISAFKSHKGEAFDPQNYVMKLTMEIMAQLITSKNLPDDFFENWKKMEEEVNYINSPGGPGRELEIFPWLRYFGNSTWKIIAKWQEWQRKTYGAIIKDRKAEFDLNEPKCLIDALYKDHTTRRSKDGHPKITETDIIILVRETLLAGIQTTFRATHGFIAIMTAYPEVQKKLQEEADEILGDREPRFADKPKMHYHEATALELLRYISHVPLLLPHKTTKDTTIGGYRVPKDTQIWVNVNSLHHDERYWDKPWTFMPERYLDEEGHFVPADHPNRRRTLPFGAGRRVCAGEVLARNRLFLFLATLVQHFNFVAAKGEDAPVHDPRKYNPGIVLKVPPYKVYAELRKE